MKRIMSLLLVFSLFLTNFPILTHAEENTITSNKEFNYEMLENYKINEKGEEATIIKFKVDNKIIYYKVKGNTIETFDENMNSMGIATAIIKSNEPIGPIDYDKHLSSRAVWDTYDTWRGYYSVHEVYLELTPGEITAGITVSLIASKMAAYLFAETFFFPSFIVAWAAEKILSKVIANEFIDFDIMYNYNWNCNILRRETLYADPGDASGASPEDDSKYQIYWSGNPNDYTQPTACRILMRNPEYAY